MAISPSKGTGAGVYTAEMREDIAVLRPTLDAGSMGKLFVQ